MEKATENLGRRPDVARLIIYHYRVNVRTQASWCVHITTLAPHCRVLSTNLFFSLFLSHVHLYVRILPPAIKITVAMFLLTAKYSFRFDCTSSDMNGRGKKQPAAKKSTANEGFCVLLKLRRFFPLTCNGYFFPCCSLMQLLARFTTYITNWSARD